MTFFKDWFPRSQLQDVPFGWDPHTLSYPRLHLARDWAAPKSIMAKAVITGRASWISLDSQGNSVLRISGAGLEARYYHFRRDELSSDAIAAIETGAEIEAGTPLGPCGNVGLIAPGSRGDGSHVHLSLVVFPGAESLAREICGDGWRDNKTADYEARYGLYEVASVLTRYGVDWINDSVICRKDGITQRRGVYVIDPLKALA